MATYRPVIIETFLNPGEPSSAKVRARPLPGQGYDTSMRVECSRSMRNSHPVGTRFLIEAKISQREAGPPFLYAHHNSQYRELTDSEVEHLLANAARRGS